MSRKPTKEDLAVIGALRERRRRLGKPQAWLAEKVGVSTQQWGKYERGQDRLSSGKANQADKALGDAEAEGLATGGFGEAMTDPYDPALPASDELLVTLKTLRSSLDRIEQMIRKTRS